MIRRVALAIMLAGCAGGRPADSRPLTAASDGPLQTAGPRCQGSTCSCRTVDDFGRASGEGSRNEGDVAPAMKRYEFRTGRGFDKMSVTIGGKGTLAKALSTVEPTCGYVELPPGRHAIRLRIEAKDKVQGIHPRLIVNEYGRNTSSWYDVFQFACGSVGPCLKDDMKEWFDKARAIDRGIYDKCGSTRVENLRWSVEHSPETTLEDLTLEFVLNVYKFEPRFAHGTPTCKGIAAGGKAAEEENMRGGADKE